MQASAIERTRHLQRAPIVSNDRELVARRNDAPSLIDAAVESGARGKLSYVLKQSDAVALFLVSQFKSSDYFAMLSEVCPQLAGSEPGQLDCEAFPRLRWVVSLEAAAPAGGITWPAFIERDRMPSSSKGCSSCATWTIAARSVPMH